MTQVVVVSTPGGAEQAAQLAARLRDETLDAEAPDNSAHWTGAQWRGIVSGWPADAFVVFCLTSDAPSDPVFTKLLWQEVPMKEDPTGRFLFVIFDPAAAEAESVSAFLKRHASFKAEAVKTIAAHVGAHADALRASVAKAAEERRKYQEELAKRPPPEAPMGVGSGRRSYDIGSGRGVEGVGAAEGPRRVGASEGFRRDDYLSSLPATRSAPPPPTSAPAPRADEVDAAAFAPKKLRRGTSELIQVTVFRPKDRGKAARAAKQADARS